MRFKKKGQGLKKIMFMVVLIIVIGVVVHINNKGIRGAIDDLVQYISNIFKGPSEAGSDRYVNIVGAYDAADQSSQLDVVAYTESLPVGGPNLDGEIVAIELDKLVDCPKVESMIKVFKGEVRDTSFPAACSPSCSNGKEGDVSRIIVSGFEESSWYKGDAEYTIRFEMDPANPPVISCSGNLALNPGRSVIGFEK
ncbi:hypothetical protein JW968_05365 [Candidatus Woesearchaeota archaeon]|nr:hypothetical protein [Candidatus Woesearchaeota archaeon]